MKKADIKVGETYLTARGRRYSYSEKKARVIAVGAHTTSRHVFEWQAQKELNAKERLQAIDDVNATGTLSPIEYKRQRQAVLVEVDKRARELHAKKQFVADGKGTGVLVAYENNFYASRARDLDPERFKSYDDDAVKEMLTIVETREFVQTWADYVANSKAALKRQAEAAEAAKQHEADMAARRENLRGILASRGLDIDIRDWTTEVKFSLEGLAELVLRIPEEATT